MIVSVYNFIKRVFLFVFFVHMTAIYLLFAVKSHYILLEIYQDSFKKRTNNINFIRRRWFTVLLSALNLTCWDGIDINCLVKQQERFSFLIILNTDS